MAKKRKHNFIKKRKSIKRSNPKTNYKEKEKEKEKAILEPIYDEPPTFDDKPDIPRRFSRLIKIKEHRIKKVRDNVKTKINSSTTTTAKNNKGTGIERLPGEPFSKFSRRLEDHMRPEILKAFYEGSSKQIKAKRYRERLKEKKKEKLNINNQNAIKDFKDLKDDIKFGEIVDKPPVITVIPKNKLRIISSPKVEKDNYGDDDDDDDDDDGYYYQKKKKHSNKSQLSLADKRIVEKERKRIIELYRSKKSNKLNKLN